MSELALYKMPDMEKTYITFKVSNELFGIDVSYVDTIIQMATITRVPAAPYYFAGIINLRGEVIPVLSLNRRFNNIEDSIGPKSNTRIRTSCSECGPCPGSRIPVSRRRRRSCRWPR